MKRYVAVTVGASTAALLLAGCSGGAGSGTSGQADGVTTLSFAMWAGSTPETEALETLVGLVEDAHPEIDLRLETAPFNDYWTRLAAQASGGTEACILGVQSPRTSSIRDLLLPLGADALSEAGIDLADFDQSIVEGTQVDGEQYAIPYDVGPLVVFYNADAFRAAGLELPTTDWTVVTHARR